MTPWVRIEARPPRPGEFGWFVDPDRPRAKWLRDVLAGRGGDHSKANNYGYGWPVRHWFDSAPDEDGDIVVTVITSMEAP